MRKNKNKNNKINKENKQTRDNEKLFPRCRRVSFLKRQLDELDAIYSDPQHIVSKFRFTPCGVLGVNPSRFYKGKVREPSQCNFKTHLQLPKQFPQRLLDFVNLVN